MKWLENWKARREWKRIEKSAARWREEEEQDEQKEPTAGGVAEVRGSFIVLAGIAVAVILNSLKLYVFGGASLMSDEYYSKAETEDLIIMIVCGVGLVYCLYRIRVYSNLLEEVRKRNES